MQRTIFHQGELNQRRSAGHAAPPPAQAAPAPDEAGRRRGRLPASPSVTTELERLAELRAKGVLTEDEFQAQKARILGQG